MKRAIRMMLVNNETRRRDGRKDGYDRPSYPVNYGGDDRFRDPRFDGGPYPGYDNSPENRFRDRRGREHYDDGRYAPQNYREGGRRYDNDTRPTGSWYNNPHDDRYGDYPHYPNPYFMPRYDGVRGPDREVQPVKMNKIGFSVDGEMERYPDEFREDYRSTMDHTPMNEMEHRQGNYVAGHGAEQSIRPMDKETAHEWAESMKNEDGTTGPHWTLEQTKQLQAQKGIDCDPVHFWVAMNMVYSDYGKVAKKLNVSNTDFFTSMAEAFLDDKDAQPDKLERYYQFVVKH